jgi:dipeptidyl-peptidase-3
MNQSFLRIERTNDDLTIFMERYEILTHALPPVEDVLLRLQVYKPTANVEEGVRYFEVFSEVDEVFEEYRDLVLKTAPARIQYVQANTYLDGGHVQLKEYHSTREGLIQSWAEKNV